MRHVVCLNILPFLAVIIVLGWVHAAPARADQYVAERIKDPTAIKIEKLVWGPKELKVRVDRVNDELRVFAYLEGQYSRDHWSLVINEKHVVVEKESNAFELPIRLTGETTEIRVIAVGLKGNVQKSKVKILFPDWGKLMADAKATPTEVSVSKRYSLVVGLGYSDLAVKETGLSDFSEIAFTAKASFLYFVVPPNWDLGGSAYFTLLPVVETPSDKSARFLGINIRGGYSMPFVAEPWRVSLLGGIYYTTMIQSGAQFGYRNLGGPQIYPTVRRIFNKGESAMAYFKYSPIASGINLLTFSNREIAYGAGWTHPLNRLHAISFFLDISAINLVIGGKQVNTSSLNFSIGYSL